MYVAIKLTKRSCNQTIAQESQVLHITNDSVTKNN